MSEFDENSLNTQNGEDRAEKAAETVNESPKTGENTGGVTFNSDGTYHGKVSSENADGNRQHNSDRSQHEQGSAKGTYPYNSSSSYPYAGSESQQRQNSGSGYRQGAYPYSNQNSSYPYSGNQDYQNSYGQKPYENNGYAYSNAQYDNNKKKNNKGIKIFAGIVGALCVFLIIALIAIVAGGNDPVLPGNDEETTNAAANNVEEFITNASPVTGNVATDGEMTPKNIFNKVSGSSVGILVYDRSKTVASEGSGVLFQESTDGKYTYIITCAHVISDSTGFIRVQLFDGNEYDAELVGFDTRTDIGVIRIEKTGLTLAEIGDSTKISVGDPVYAIGNPGGVEFANSFTNGIVSALDRPVNSSATGYTTECIQHTAAINPGNSGGALVNAFGQVIGINSMKIVADEYEGMGFAVPSSVFVEIVNEITAHGYVSNRPKLGITYVSASEYSSYGMFVAIKGLPSGSIVIYEIAEDSALAGTEAKAGDMITAVNGKPLDDASYLSELIEESDVGDKLTLTIVRIHDDYSSEEFEVVATLVEDRGDTVISDEQEEEDQIPGSGGSGDYYGDYFEKYFEDYFNDYFGGYAP